MPYAFFGIIPMEIEIRVLGTLAKRKLRAIYSYTPPWPFFDPETKTEKSAPFHLGVSLKALTQPGLRVAIEDREPDWVPVDQLLEWGVLSSRAHDKLDKLIDADARLQDRRRRKKGHKARSAGNHSDLG
jgi:hypothetical protein